MLYFCFSEEVIAPCLFAFVWLEWDDMLDNRLQSTTRIQWNVELAVPSLRDTRVLETGERVDY